MTSPIIVVGHRNPDNDSVASAVAYAYLKNRLAERAGTGETTALPEGGAGSARNACGTTRSAR